MKKSKQPILKSDSEFILLLEDCQSAMTAAGYELWNVQRDLAIALGVRAVRCRKMIQELKRQGEKQ